MTLLAIDPSSKRTGWALFRGGTLAGAGYLKPGKVSDGSEVRIRCMAGDLVRLIEAEGVELVVAETSSGKVGKRHGGAGAGLAVYGMAVGWLCGAAAMRVEVQCVIENVWTEGVPKATRQGRVAIEFPAYRRAIGGDAGADVADAIGIGLWWLTRSKRRALGL